MDTTNVIRIVSAVLFVVVLFILIQRRKGRSNRG
jgi:preprotein translocase subunit SecG